MRLFSRAGLRRRAPQPLDVEVLHHLWGGTRSRKNGAGSCRSVWRHPGRGAASRLSRCSDCRCPLRPAQGPGGPIAGGGVPTAPLAHYTPPNGVPSVPRSAEVPLVSSRAVSRERNKTLIAVIVGAVCVLALAVALVLVLTGKSNPVHTAGATTGASTATSTTLTTTPTTTTPPPTTVPPEETAAKALSVLLSQSVSDRSAINAATNDVTSCGPTLSRDAGTFQTASASRQTLLSQLSSLQDSSSLPPQLLQTLGQAWEASQEVDNDYANWASDEDQGGCRYNDTSNSYYAAANTPNQQATLYKTGFSNQWNPIASQYGLATYQWTQL